MHLIDILRLAIANLKRNRLRTFLTILGVGIGIGAIIFLVSLGYGLQNLAISKIASMEALTIIQVSKGNSEETLLTKENVEKFKKIEGVEGISAVYSLPGKISQNNHNKDCIVYGINPEFLKAEDIEVNLGRPFQDYKANEAIVSRAALDKFDFKEIQEMLGREIEVSITLLDKHNNIILKEYPDQKQKVKIVGITAEDKVSAVYLPLGNFENLPLEAYFSVKVKVKSKEDVDRVKGIIEGMGFPTSSIKQTIAQIERLFLAVKIVLGAFGMIALLVASIGIFNTMTIALLERTKEIGIMKAVGATDSDVKRVFNTESGLIGLLGGIMGLFIGYLLGVLTNGFVNYLAMSFGGQPNDIFYTPINFAVGTVIFAFVVSLIAGIYPSKRAAKLNPIEALRYE